MSSVRLFFLHSSGMSVGVRASVHRVSDAEESSPDGSITAMFLQFVDCVRYVCVTDGGSEDRPVPRVNCQVLLGHPYGVVMVPVPLVVVASCAAPAPAAVVGDQVAIARLAHDEGAACDPPGTCGCDHIGYS